MKYYVKTLLKKIYPIDSHIERFLDAFEVFPYEKREILLYLFSFNLEYGLDKKCFFDYLESETVYSSVEGKVELPDEDTKNKIKWLEDNYDVKVYHVIWDARYITLLYYSRDPIVKYKQTENIKKGFPRVYAFNRADDDCSEFGSVNIAGFFDALCRVDVYQRLRNLGII